MFLDMPNSLFLVKEMLYSTTMVEIDSLSASFGEKKVFQNISFSLSRGNTLSVVGPSGCGKTTLLHILAGLHPPHTGSVLFDGNPIPEGDPRVGLILQTYGLFPWMTVRENVELGLRIRGISKDDRRRESKKWLKHIRLPDVEDRYPTTLSGGQKQRVALARTLISEPSLLLMDEPFSSLDSITREDLQDFLRELLGEISIITIFVTHSIEEAVLVGSRVLLFFSEPSYEHMIFPIDLKESEKSRDNSTFTALCGTIRNSMRNKKSSHRGYQ